MLLTRPLWGYLGHLETFGNGAGGEDVLDLRCCSPALWLPSFHEVKVKRRRGQAQATSPSSPQHCIELPILLLESPVTTGLSSPLDHTSSLGHQQQHVLVVSK